MDVSQCDSNFHGLVMDIGRWADATFGKRDPLRLCKRLKEEVDELAQSNCEDMGEYADCAMILFDIARLKGKSPADVFFAMEQKLVECSNRKWCSCHHKEGDHQGKCSRCDCTEFIENGT